ncbi:MAG: hypothetical protein CFE26_18340, partial [Verrucomicrobiales bacterium VVV1]
MTLKTGGGHLGPFLLFQRLLFVMRALSILFASIPLLHAAEPLPLIPQPKSVEMKDGSFSLPDTVGIRMPAELKNEGSYLDQRLKSGLGHPVSASGESAIKLSISSGLPADGYVLNVAPSGVSIEGQNATGVFYGIQTLLQLLPPQVYGKDANSPIKASLPLVTIHDSPALPWRGLHLDSARHFMPKEFVMKLLDLMAIHKLNRLHWHLVDSEGWRREIKKYPQLTEAEIQTLVVDDKWLTGNLSTASER